MQKLLTKDYQILYTPREDQYDEILQLASLNLNCKYVALSIKSENGFWLKSKIGFDFEEVSHDDSFWQYQSGDNSELLIIDDCTKVEGLKENPLVKSDPGVIFYAGSPILDNDNELLGVLSVFDIQHKTISEDQRKTLKILSRQVLRLLEAGKEEIRLAQTTTELQETKHQLKESEKYFKSLIDNAGDILYEISSAGKFIFVNQLFEKISGYTADEVIGKSYWEIVEKPYRSELQEFYSKQAKDLKSISYYEFPITSKSGKRCWIGQNVRMNFSGRKVVKTIVVARDISEQREVGRKLNKYKNGLRLINYIASNNQFSVDEQIDMALEVGRNYLSLDVGIIGQVKKDNFKLKYIRIDYTTTEIKLKEEYKLNKVFSDITFNKDDVVAYHNIGQSELKDHVCYLDTSIEAYIGIPFYVKGKKQGTISFFSLKPKSDPFDENEIDFIRLFSKWIGFTLERESTNKSMLSEQDMLRSFATFSPAAIAMFNTNMEYIAITDKWREYNGLGDLEIIGRNHYVVEGDVKEEWRPLHMKALQGEVIKVNHDTFFNWKKEKRQVKWEARPWYNNDNEIGGIIIFFEDITELTIKENELKQAKIAAEEASAAKDQFLSTMSHEIRTPLNAVIGASHLLLHESPREDQKENLFLMKNSGEHLLALVNDILDFNKIEEGQLKLENTTFDLTTLLDTARNTLRYLADDKNIELKWLIPEDLPDAVIGDPTRLSQIIINLMGNAIKFTSHGFVMLKVTLQKNLTKKARLLFEIKDSGIGISKEKQQSIFNTFTQADTDTTRKYGGSGLGLAITKKLLEMMDSRISVESELGVGSTFFFTVTLKKGNSEMLEKQISVSQSAIQGRPNKKILLVEDNEVNRILATKFLVKWGMQVESAENGLVCLDKIKSKDFDLILMDLQMPEMDGYEATKILRQSQDSYYKNIPIIALTAAALIEAQQKVKEVGMNDFVTKPFHPKEFRDKLEKHLKPSVEDK
ncbi:MAG: PAS domain S-box protein [Bacteroidota bacterium]